VFSFIERILESLFVCIDLGGKLMLLCHMGLVLHLRVQEQLAQHEGQEDLCGSMLMLQYEGTRLDSENLVNEVEESVIH
jgi:hypothetical protein